MSGEMNDFHALLERVRLGSDDAARELVDRYGDHVLRVIRRRLSGKLRTHFDSEDFSQAVWLSFFASRPGQTDFRESRELRMLLTAMARNKVIDGFRLRFQSAKRASNRDRSLDGSVSYQAKNLRSRQPTPSQVIAAREEYARIASKLPDHYRQVLELVQQGESYRDIARQIGLHERTVQRVIRQLGPIVRMAGTK